jgi:ATP-dependent helicase/nuclease subunit A
MMAANAKNWTDAQLDGIQTVGASILVNAAAGSGKTAVLAERCAHLVCKRDDPCEIDQLLVVTFTDSAAAEMKSRIQETLRGRLAHEPSPRLSRQVALVEHANVSTVHGFCSRLLHQHFNLVGLDPDFKVLDGDEAELLRLEVATDLFHQRYDADKSGDFHRFIDSYGDGNDERLIEQVISAHQLLCSLVNPKGWTDNARTEINQAATQPMEASNLGCKFIEQITKDLNGLLERSRDAWKALRSMDPAFKGYLDQLTELGTTLKHWQQVLKDEGLNMLVSEVRDFKNTKLPQAPRIKERAGKDLAKSMLDSIKHAMRKSDFVENLSLTTGQWQQGMVTIAPHANVFLSLIEDFGAQYDAAKDAVRSLDFSDLERLALRVLREGKSDADELKPSAVARSLHNQFRHVLVDEYQDINEIQDAIIKLASHECEGNPRKPGNLFCVGDVKQSIFRFRLADPNRFLQREEFLSSTAGAVVGKLISLRENFRSRPALLGCINAVFRGLMTRESAEIEYDQSHHLQAGQKFPAPGALPEFTGAPIELHLLPDKLGGETSEAGEEKTERGENDEKDEPGDFAADMERADYEAVLVAKRINQITGRDGTPPMHVLKRDAAGNLAPTPIGLADIVILLRSMQYKADTFADVLTRHGIPVHSEGGQGFFQATEVRDIICLLQVLDNQQQDIPLAAVLRSPLAGIPDADDALAQIRIRYRSEAGEIPFHQAVARYAQEQNDELAAHLQDFLDQLQAWRDLANKRPVAELLWQLYDQTGYLAYCSGLEDGRQRVANLIQLHQRAGQFGTFLRQGLYRFLKFLQSLKEQKDIRRPSVVGQAEQVVRIMSIHRAKGLEFPVVILPDLGKKHNLQDTAGAILVDRAAGLGLAVVDQERLIRYPSLASTLVETSLHRQTLAEEMRLLYVAMTRAKEHLILVGTTAGAAMEKWLTQWQDRSGPLPADVVLGARTMLDWIGPVEAMSVHVPPPIFKITIHTAEEVRAWPNPRAKRAGFNALQTAMANLELCHPPPLVNEEAQQVINRFEARYQFEPFALQAATASVTSLAKGLTGDAMELESDVQSDRHEPFERKLDLPVFFSAAAPKATDIGNATHLVLQHWDFSVPGAAAEIDRQITQMLARKLITAIDAKLVDRASIGWFLKSSMGEMLRTHHANLMREVPFAMDQLMVRGRIDLLFPTPEGLVIVDYKTDNVEASELTNRVDLYRKQMQFYRQAIDKVAGQKVAGIYLIFLKAKEVVSC